MDKFINDLLAAWNFDEWLDKRGLGFLVSDPIIQFLTIVIGTVTVYYIGRVFLSYGARYIIRHAAKQRAWHRKDREKREKTIQALITSSWRIIMLIYAVAMIANKLFGFDLSPLFASAGIIGVAIGFGSQSLVKDFLTGIFIISENQYRVGDVVDIMGSVGTVERVGTRSTVIRDRDGSVHYIPNGTIQRVINKTMGYSMTRFSIDVAADTNIDKAVKLINNVGETLMSDPAWKRKIIDAPQFVAIGEVTEKSIELIISGKTMPSDQWSVTLEMRNRLMVALDKKDVTVTSLPAADINR